MNCTERKDSIANRILAQLVAAREHQAVPLVAEVEVPPDLVEDEETEVVNPMDLHMAEIETEMEEVV